MERYLITQSLLSSWQYLFECHEGYEDEAMADFLRVLNREKSEPNEYMLAGIEFENEVYKAAGGYPREFHQKWENGIAQVAERIVGCQYQVKLKRDLEAGGMRFLCFGILDALGAGIIYDVKKKAKSFGSSEVYGNYVSSPQHPMYFYLCPEATEFQYLVSDGNDLYIEQYRPEETRNIVEIITEFISSITELGLLDLYKEKWLAL